VIALYAVESSPACPDLGDLAVVDREQVLRRSAIDRAVAELAQHGVSRLQHPLVVLGGREVVGPQVEHAAVDEPTAVGGRGAGQREVLRGEHDDVEAAEVASERPHRLAVEQHLARTSRELDLVEPHQLVLHDPRAKLRALAAKSDEIRELGRAERPQRGDRKDRFEQVRLALTVVAGEHVESLARFERHGPQVAHAAGDQRLETRG